MNVRLVYPPGFHLYDHRCQCSYCTTYEKSLQKATWESEKKYRASLINNHPNNIDTHLHTDEHAQLR